MEDFHTSYAPYHRVSVPFWLPWTLGAAVLATFSMQFAVLHQQAAIASAVADLQTVAALRGELKVTSAPEPSRFLLDGLTPSADQSLRGDCWLFSTTGMLEDSYRRYGVERGWFNRSEYLRLSRQALGIAFLEECAKTPNSFCPAVNTLPGNTLVWGFTAEGQDGADERLMAYLPAVGAKGAVPNSVCEYYTGNAADPNKPDPHAERACDKLPAMREHNPLAFSVKAVKTHFARDDIKRSLRETGYPLTLGLGEISTPHYVPCEERAGCDRATATCLAVAPAPPAYLRARPLPPSTPSPPGPLADRRASPLPHLAGAVPARALLRGRRLLRRQPPPDGVDERGVVPRASRAAHARRRPLGQHRRLQRPRAPPMRMASVARPSGQP